MILPHLRERTRALHQRLERAVNLPARLNSIDAYAQFLEAFYGLYQPLEGRLAAHSSLSDSGLGHRRLEKHLLLEQDLRSLGRSANAIEMVPKCSTLPDLESFFSAAGCLYVLEGATLGGQVVRREVNRRLNLPAGDGCRFFNSYGDGVGPMWSEFCDRLTTLAGDDAPGGESIVKGASDTFICFEEWMR